MGKGIMLSDKDLQLIKVISDNVNSNTDAHTCEAIEVVSIHIQNEYKKYNDEVFAVISMQNDIIKLNQIETQSEFERVWKEINKGKESAVIVHVPKLFIKVITWFTISIIILGVSILGYLNFNNK